MKWDTYHTKGITSEYLYRYVSLEKLLSFLETGTLYFSRMDCFEDNLEGIVPYDITELVENLEPLPNEEERNPDIPGELWKEKENDRVQMLREIQKQLLKKQEKSYVSCWFLGNTESIAMWDLYGKDGFLIRFERKKLQELVKSKIKKQEIEFKDSDLLVAGKVKYQDFEKIPYQEKENLLKYSGFRKHLAFMHEEEYRFILHTQKSLGFGLKYNLDTIENIDFQLFANPRMSMFTFNTYSELIKRYTAKHKLMESKLKPWLEFKNKKF